MSDSGSGSDNEDVEIKINITRDELFGKNKSKYKKGKRSHQLTLFYSVLDSNTSFACVNKPSLARKLERGCYNGCKKLCIYHDIKTKWSCSSFVHVYYTICYELYKALDSDKLNTAYSPELVYDIINDIVDPETLGEQDALSINKKRNIEAKEIIERSKGTSAIEFRGSSYYQCMCGSSSTRTVSQQDRGLDEGSSKKVICLVCNNTWSEK